MKGKGWLVIGFCIAAIAVFIVILWTIGKYL